MENNRIQKNGSSFKPLINTKTDTDQPAPPQTSVPSSVRKAINGNHTKPSTHPLLANVTSSNKPPLFETAYQALNAIPIGQTSQKRKALIQALQALDPSSVCKVFLANGSSCEYAQQQTSEFFSAYHDNAAHEESLKAFAELLPLQLANALPPDLTTACYQSLETSGLSIEERREIILRHLVIAEVRDNSPAAYLYVNQPPIEERISAIFSLPGNLTIDQQVKLYLTKLETELAVLKNITGYPEKVKQCLAKLHDLTSRPKFTTVLPKVPKQSKEQIKNCFSSCIGQRLAYAAQIRHMWEDIAPAKHEKTIVKIIFEKIGNPHIRSQLLGTLASWQKNAPTKAGTIARLFALQLADQLTPESLISNFEDANIPTEEKETVVMLKQELAIERYKEIYGEEIAFLFSMNNKSIADFNAWLVNSKNQIDSKRQQSGVASNAPEPTWQKACLDQEISTRLNKAASGLSSGTISGWTKKWQQILTAAIPYPDTLRALISSKSSYQGDVWKKASADQRKTVTKLESSKQSIAETPLTQRLAIEVKRPDTRESEQWAAKILIEHATQVEHQATKGNEKEAALHVEEAFIQEALKGAGLNSAQIQGVMKIAGPTLSGIRQRLSTVPVNTRLIRPEQAHSSSNVGSQAQILQEWFKTEETFRESIATFADLAKVPDLAKQLSVPELDNVLQAFAHLQRETLPFQNQLAAINVTLDENKQEVSPAYKAEALAKAISSPLFSQYVAAVASFCARYTSHLAVVTQASQMVNAFNCSKKIQDTPQTVAVKEAVETLRNDKVCLADLLITPVQRLPRHQLLAADLLKHTSQNDTLHSAIEKALGAASSAAQTVNEFTRAIDSTKA